MKFKEVSLSLRRNKVSCADAPSLILNWVICWRLETTGAGILTKSKLLEDLSGTGSVCGGKWLVNVLSRTLLQTDILSYGPYLLYLLF